MTKTTNYQLPKWEKTDRIQMKDFNDMTATLDAALKANADTAAAADAAVALCGNCKIETSTYTGTGTYGSANPTTLTFPKKPRLIIIFGTSALTLIHGDNMEDYSPIITYSNNTAVWRSNRVSWSGATLSFYNETDARSQANTSGTIYHVTAFYAQDK